jgi:DNA METHYLASE-TYPE I RESTRICTION-MODIFICATION SYSTEM
MEIKDILKNGEYDLLTDFSKDEIKWLNDTHGHIFVKHDLFNHDPELENKNPYNLYSQDGIAEAFLEFARQEGLSFVKEN